MDTTTKALPRLTKNWPAPWLSKYTALFGKMVARGSRESVAAHRAEAMIRREHDRAESADSAVGPNLAAAPRLARAA